jgi:hypothetical protein
MLKRLIHFLTSRSLEKHKQKTQCMIHDYEREAAASQARVQAQADTYKHEIQQLAQLREEELKKYVGLLNDHIEQTTQYTALLKELPPAMFLCVEVWLRKNISEQRWQLEKDKAHAIHSTIAYLEELASEMIRLSRKEDRRTWQTLIADRPPRVSTPEISKHAKQFLRDAKTDAKAFDPDLRRIQSYIRELRKQQSEIRKSASALKVDVEKNREQHRQVKQRVKELNERCSTKFRALQEVFENYYQYSQSDSPLANNWFSQMPYGGNLQEINQLISQTAPDWEDAKSSLAELHSRRESVKLRISWAHDTKEYSNLDAYKAERVSISQAISVAKAHRSNLHEAREVLFHRREEIKKLLGWINEFHPSKTIEQVFRLLARDDADIYWPAIGLQTKAVRRSAGGRK